MIPKIINQIWIGDAPPPERWMSTWREKHSGWKYRLWTDRDLDLLPAPVRERMEKVPEVFGKVDLMRWSLLHRFGGVFIDADSECLQALPDEMLAHRFFSCWEHEFLQPGLAACGCMGGVPGDELTATILNTILASADTGEPSWLQYGPGALSRALASRPWPEVRIYPSHYFLPRHYSGMRHTGPGPVYARHYWGSTLGYGESAKGTEGCLVLSPHCDDVPLSLGAALCARQLGPSVEVAVVFTRSRFTLSERGTAPMLPTTRLRIKEEHRAAEIAGYGATFLPFAESYGRPGLSTPREILDPRRDPRNDPVWPGVREAVRELVRDHRGPVLAPLGCTSHIDHRIVSLAARELPEEDPGRELAFYEDLPYAAFLPREILESLVPTHPSGDPYERFPLRGGSLESKIALLRSYPSQMNGGILDQVRLHWEGTGGENLWRRRQG